MPALELHALGRGEKQVEPPVALESRIKREAEQPPSPLAWILTLATGLARSRPRASSRRIRPGRSVISARPSGRKASSHGISRPVAITSTRGWPSDLGADRSPVPPQPQPQRAMAASRAASRRIPGPRHITSSQPAHDAGAGRSVLLCTSSRRIASALAFVSTPASIRPGWSMTTSLAPSLIRDPFRPKPWTNRGSRGREQVLSCRNGSEQTDPKQPVRRDCERAGERLTVPLRPRVAPSTGHESAGAPGEADQCSRSSRSKVRTGSGS